MFRSLHVAATGMAAQETKLDTIANNLANANTTGYKRQDAEFEDLLYQTVREPAPRAGGGTAPTAVHLGAGTRVVATPRYFSQGAFIQTGNPLDIAIEGPGLIPVQMANGEMGYTRSGGLKLDGQGQIVTSDGLLIEPSISVPADATGITISSDGTISAVQPGEAEPAILGQLQLVTFANPGGLRPIGRNLFALTSAAGDPTAGTPGQDGRGTVMQGALEGSNVEVVSEMVSMIRTQRAYELNSKVIEAADEMLRNATQMR